MNYYRLRARRLYHTLMKVAEDRIILPDTLILSMVATFSVFLLLFILAHLPLLTALLIMLGTGALITLAIIHLAKYCPPSLTMLDTEINRLRQRRAAIKENPAFAKVPTSLLDDLYQIN